MNVGQKNSRSISVLCSLLGYSRQGFYQGIKACEQEALESELVVQEVVKIRKDQKMVGTRKLFIHLEPFFKAHGISMGRDALFTMLANYNLLIRKRKRKTPVTTFSNHWMHKYPNLTMDFVSNSAHQLLVSDITYIRLTESRHAYLSLVTDGYSRKIVGWHLNATLAARGCIAAMKMAAKQLPKGSKTIHHSDRGSQYCCFDYVALLNKNNIDISMTQSGDPLENAIAERVNGTIKNEFLQQAFNTLKEARDAIAHSISVYNNIRLHASIDMLTPTQAHNKSGVLKRHWKSYYPNKKEEVVYVD